MAKRIVDVYKIQKSKEMHNNSNPTTKCGRDRAGIGARPMREVYVAEEQAEWVLERPSQEVLDLWRQHGPSGGAAVSPNRHAAVAEELSLADQITSTRRVDIRQEIAHGPEQHCLFQACEWSWLITSHLPISTPPG